MRSLKLSPGSLALSLPVALVVKNPPANAGDIRDLSWIPGLGRCPGGANGNPLQYSCLENPMDRGAWRATVHRIAKSQTQLKWLSTLSLSVSLSPPPPSLPHRSPALGKPAARLHPEEVHLELLSLLQQPSLPYRVSLPLGPGSSSTRQAFSPTHRDPGSEPLSQVTPGFLIHRYHVR